MRLRVSESISGMKRLRDEGISLRFALLLVPQG